MAKHIACINGKLLDTWAQAENNIQHGKLKIEIREFDLIFRWKYINREWIGGIKMYDKKHQN